MEEPNGKVERPKGGSEAMSQDSREKEDVHISREAAKRTRVFQITLSVCLVCLYVAMGLYDGLLSTTLPDLRDRLDTTTDQVTFARSFKEIGRLVGGILAGVGSDRFQSYSKLMLSGSLVLVGGAVVAVPWAAFLPVLGTLYFIEGTCQGGIDSVSNALITSLWGESADPALHSIHFGYTVGSALSPVLTSPFISPSTDDVNCTLLNDTVTMPDCDLVTTESTGGFLDNSRIEIPYAVAGSVTVFVGLVFFVLWMVGPPKQMGWHSPEKKSLREVFSPGSCSGGRSGLGSLVVGLLVFYYVLMQAQGIGQWTLNFTYATELDLDFDKQDAAFMDFTGRMCSMAGRALIIPISRFLSPTILLISTVTASTICIGLMAFVGTQFQIAFWVILCCNSFLSAPAWGAAYAFIDKYIILYAFVVALTSLGAGLAGFAFQSLHGFLYENSVRESFYYLSFALSVAWLAITVIMYLVARKLGYRHGGSDEEGEDGEEFVVREVAMELAVREVVVKEVPNWQRGQDELNHITSINTNNAFSSDEPPDYQQQISTRL